jgi:predicted transporter
MLYWLKLACGLVAGVLSILWLVHVVLYVFLNPPLYGFLNTFFSAMDTVFPLFGTLAFAIFCFYLIGAHAWIQMEWKVHAGCSALADVQRAASPAQSH